MEIEDNEKGTERRIGYSWSKYVWYETGVYFCRESCVWLIFKAHVRGRKYSSRWDIVRE